MLQYWRSCTPIALASAPEDSASIPTAVRVSIHGCVFIDGKPTWFWLEPDCIGRHQSARGVLTECPMSTTRWRLFNFAIKLYDKKRCDHLWYSDTCMHRGVRMWVGRPDADAGELTCEKGDVPPRGEAAHRDARACRPPPPAPPPSPPHVR